MRIIAAGTAALGLTLILAGCGGSGTDQHAASPSRSAAPPSPSPSPSPSPTQPATRDVRDCYDADCTLLVTKPLRIPLNAKLFHYPAVIVESLAGGTLTYRVDYPQGGMSEAHLSPGNSSSFGYRSATPITVKLLSLKHGTAILSLTPG